MHELAVVLSGRVVDGLTEGLVSQLVTEPVSHWLASRRNQHDFRSALSEALESTADAGFRLTGEGAVDDSFLLHEGVVHELWMKLLDPSVEEEVNMSRLVGFLSDIWRNQPSLPDGVKAAQREAIEFLVDELCNKILWRRPEFYPRLNARILRSLDGHVTATKRKLMVKSYVKSEASRLRGAHSLLLAGGAYVEPVVQLLKDVPDQPESFRHRLGTVPTGVDPKQGLDCVTVDASHFFIAGPEAQIVVVADSGYGKSTLLYDVFLRACGNWQMDRPVPFHFMPEQASGCGDEELAGKVRERLVATLPSPREAGGFRTGQVDTLVRDMVSSGQLLLLFDALDQMRDPDSLVGFLASPLAKRCRVILTTRPEAWALFRSRLSGFAHARIVEFDRERIVTYLGALSDRPEIQAFSAELLGVPILAC